MPFLVGEPVIKDHKEGDDDKPRSPYNIGAGKQALDFFIFILQLIQPPHLLIPVFS